MFFQFLQKVFIIIFTCRLVIYGWKEINDDNFIPALHMFSQLKNLDLRGTNITIKSCREAALNLPMLKCMDVIKNHRVKKTQVNINSHKKVDEMCLFVVFVVVGTASKGF